jgi:hypothetical protein
MKTRSICKRCHRLRPVNQVRYCADCAGIIRNMEKPRPAPVKAAEPPTPGNSNEGGAPLEAKAAETASSDDAERVVKDPPASSEFIAHVEDLLSEKGISPGDYQTLDAIAGNVAQYERVLPGQEQEVLRIEEKLQRQQEKLAPAEEEP